MFEYRTVWSSYQEYNSLQKRKKAKRVVENKQTTSGFTIKQLLERLADTIFRDIVIWKELLYYCFI